MKRLLHISPDLALPRDTVTSTLVVYGGKGMGKRLALDTPIATPDGWTTMGALKVGDSIFDDFGEPCKVTFISPIAMGDSYKLEFSDGSSIVADAEHLWSTETYQDRKHGRPPGVKTTLDIANTLLTRQGKQVVRTHSIRNTQPLNLPKRLLPIAPYILGAWLGDGTSASGQFTTQDADILLEIAAEGYKTCLQPSIVNGETASYSILGIKDTLRTLGLLRNKHVPKEYLRASISQRLAILQGLMDTDGGWSEATGSTAEFSNLNRDISQGLYELVVSLGMKASINPRTASIGGRIIGTDWRVRFIPTLPAIYLDTDSRPMITRWRLTDEERRSVANGADIVLQQLTWRNPFQPINVQIVMPNECPALVEEP